MPWNAEQYHKFQSQRSASFYDLLKLAEIRLHLKIVDLGCGTGELTRVLADALPDSEVVGLDSSAEMLEKAASYATPNLRIEQGDLSRLTGAWDLIFSNAAIQWVDHHEELIPYLISQLNPGGQLCIQIPSNHQYAEIVFEQNTENIIVFEKVYPHILEDSDAVVEWISGTAFIPYFERLGDHKPAFLDVLRKKMSQALPESPLLYPFRRILFSAKKPG